MQDKSTKIIGFLCNWCSYAGADMAGTARMKQPANLRIVRMPCTGRVNPLLVLKAFQEGADGVLVSGCHPGDCHYNDGNYYARRRLELLSRMLPAYGIEPERFHYTWVSASEGARWAQVVEEFTTTVERLGKLNLGDVPALNFFNQGDVPSLNFSDPDSRDGSTSLDVPQSN